MVNLTLNYLYRRLVDVFLFWYTTNTQPRRQGKKSKRTSRNRRMKIVAICLGKCYLIYFTHPLNFKVLLFDIITLAAIHYAINWKLLNLPICQRYYLENRINPSRSRTPKQTRMMWSSQQIQRTSFPEQNFFVRIHLLPYQRCENVVGDLKGVGKRDLKGVGKRERNIRYCTWLFWQH